MAESDSRETPMGAVARRSCGGCTLCCYVLGVDELAKPKNVRCQHCADDVGCKIYEDRPSSCRSWACAWLKYDQIPETLYPKTSHLIISEGEALRIALVAVDPAFPDAWRQEPHYSFLKSAATRACADHRLLVVRIGRRQIVLLPDRDLDMGEIADDEELSFSWVAAAPAAPPRLEIAKRPKAR